MPLILGANSVSGYTVKNSLRFNSGSSDYLSRTYGTPTNNLKYTKSFWIKRSGLTDIAKGFVWCSLTNTNTDYFYFDASNQILVGNSVSPNTTAVFRDVSAWYHCVMVFDSANATAANRLILYINNVQQTLSTTITLNSTGGNQSGVTYTIGYQGGVSRYLDAYMSEIYMIDGQALTPSSFGETDTLSGIWIPKAYTGTFGTNGFYLQFKNSASLGTDSSGNGNTFTVNNLTSVDQTTDTPTNNFCTWNSLSQSSYQTLSDGNLTSLGNTAVDNGNVYANMAVDKGKWYAEFKVQASSGYPNIGIANMEIVGYRGTLNSTAGWILSTNVSPSVGYGDSLGRIYTNGVSGTAYTVLANNNIVGIAIDLDNGAFYLSINGTYLNSGSPTSGASRTGALSTFTPIGTLYTFGCGNYNSSKVEANFGNPPYSANSYTDGAGYGNFSYAVPSGYYSLCTKNLANFG